MRIAIVGTGGVGGGFGAAMAKAGADVTFIARGAHLAAMKSQGLKLLSPRGDIHLVPTKAATSHVISRQFRGSENLYAVSLPSGQIVHSSQGSTSVYQEGTPVELRVLASHTVLFRQADAG